MQPHSLSLKILTQISLFWFLSHILGDSFSGTNGLPFTTKDQDNDSYDTNCAVKFKGAWWYSACHRSNLNGMYLRGAHESHADGVEWHGFRGHYYSLKDTMIKIRPTDFQMKLDDVAPK